jgi:hypothetical protein
MQKLKMYNGSVYCFCGGGGLYTGLLIVTVGEGGGLNFSYLVHWFYERQKNNTRNTQDREYSKNDVVVYPCCKLG